METLREKRCRFSRNVTLLGQYISLQGYEYAFDQFKRTQAEADANVANATGISRSLHILGLAVDINLYKDGVYLESSESHRFSGEFWKSLGADHRWGGDFRPKQDGNHYSIEHDGVK